MLFWCHYMDSWTLKWLYDDSTMKHKHILVSLYRILELKCRATRLLLSWPSSNEIWALTAFASLSAPLSPRIPTGKHAGIPNRRILLSFKSRTHVTSSPSPKKITAHKTSTRCFVSVIPPVFARPPRVPAPPTLLHTFSVTPELGIKDPSTISLTTFTSERGSIMEQLEREWTRLRRLTDVGGGGGGGRGAVEGWTQTSAPLFFKWKWRRWEKRVRTCLRIGLNKWTTL